MSPSKFKPGDRVIYVPSHAHGNLRHVDCEAGVVTNRNERFVFVRFGTSRHSQAVDPDFLVREASFTVQSLYAVAGLAMLGIAVAFVLAMLWQIKEKFFP